MGVPLGTVFQGGTLLAILGAGLMWWIKGMPDRRRAMNEAEQIAVNEAELIRTDYAKQIAAFRTEVHGYKNELQAIYGQLALSESARRRRDDRIASMMFVLRLLMSELRRLDADSVVLQQAESMLKQMEDEDQRYAKRDALTAAHDTEQAAHFTVEALKREGGGK